MKDKTSNKASMFLGVLLSLGVASTVQANVEADADTLVAASVAEPISSQRLIVRYKDNAKVSSKSLLGGFSAKAGINSQDSGLKYMRELATGDHLVQADKKMSAVELEEMISDMEANPNIESVEVDQLWKPMFTPNDSRYNEQWHYFESAGGINLPSAWDTTSGAGVVVAVLDTGYTSHYDLNDNILPGYDMISDTDVSQDGDGRDSDASDPGDWAPPGACGRTSNSSWHGTHVAGTIAAETNNGTGVAGVAYSSKILPLRVLGRCGGYTSDIADAMIWAAGGYVPGTPSNPYPAKVLNLSLGGTGGCPTVTQNAIYTARGLGATVVVAAGNSNDNVANHTPANCSGVITVASVGRDGGRAFYSNYGSGVDIAAPGGETNVSRWNGVLSTLNNGSQGPGSDNFEYYQGTSMATPHVAGVAALLYAVDSNMTPDKAESIIKSTARSFPASCSQCGAGIVDAAAAVAKANSGGSSSCTWNDGSTWPLCSFDNGGWGWENGQSCISNSICPSTGTPSQCTWEDGSVWPMCKNDTGGWGWENGQSCISASICP